MKTITQTLPPSTRLHLMAYKTRATKQKINLLQQQYDERLLLENALIHDTRTFFTQLNKKIIKTYTQNIEENIPEYNNIAILTILLEEITTTYQQILYEYSLYAYQQGTNHTQQLTQLLQQHKTHTKQKHTIIQKITNTIQKYFKTPTSNKKQTTLDEYQQKQITPNAKLTYTNVINKYTKQQLQQYTYKSTEKLTQNITKDITRIITEGTRKGIGATQVRENLQERLNHLTTWQAERIARTEITTIQNNARYNKLQDDDNIEYVQWSSANDHRTRESHLELDGIITRKGNPFPNGCKFPGDKTGPIKEWINCRCAIIPYIPDWNKIPPSNLAYWKEDDMITLPEDTKQIIDLKNNEWQVHATTTASIDEENPVDLTKLDTKELKQIKQNLITELKNTKVPQGLTPEEQETHDKLTQKLLSNGGKIKLEKGKVILEKTKGLTFKEKKQLQKLHEKKLGILKPKTKQTQEKKPERITRLTQLTKKEQETIETTNTFFDNYYEQLERFTDKYYGLHEKITQLKYEKRDLIDEKWLDVFSKQFEKQVKLIPEDQEKYKTLKQLLQENPTTQNTAKLKMFIKRRTPQELREKLENDTQKILDQELIQINKKIKRLNREADNAKKWGNEVLPKRLDRFSKEYHNILKDTEIPPHTIVSHESFNSSITGKKVYMYDGINEGGIHEPDYMKYSAFTGSAKVHETEATRLYGEGSSIYSQYHHAKNKGATEHELKTLLRNYLNGPIDKINKNYKGMAVEELEHTLVTQHEGLVREAKPLKENTFVLSGQDKKYWEGYTEGDTVKLTSEMSTALSEEATHFFLHKNIKRNGEAILIEMEVDKGVEMVPMNLRGAGAYDHESEMILLDTASSNYEAKVVGFGEKFMQDENYYDTLGEGVTIPTIKIHIGVKQ